MQIKLYINSFLNLLFPGVCVACNTSLAGNEKYICTTCLSNLPYTNFWLIKDNSVEELFWGRVQVEAAASFVYFNVDTRIQKILHYLKYKQKPEIGVLMGKIFGHKLIGSRFDEVDVIIPIPLHKSRQKKRGYNQSEMIAQGLSQSMDKPIELNAIVRAAATKTQTNKSRFDRWLNVENVFRISINPQKLIDKHVLIVDDVVTTGATSGSVMSELIKIPGVKVSFVALACA